MNSEQTEKKIPNKYDLIREKTKEQENRQSGASFEDKFFKRGGNQAKEKQKADDFFNQKSNKPKDQQEK